MTQTYRDQPDLVREYFAKKGLDCTIELQEDNRRCGRTQSNTSRGTPSKNKGHNHQSSAERPRSMDMTPAERAKHKRMKRFQENDRKLAEQQKAQNLSVSTMMFDKPCSPENSQIGTPIPKAQPSFSMPFGHTEEPRGSTAVTQEPDNVWSSPFEQQNDEEMAGQAGADESKVDLNDSSMWTSKRRDPPEERQKQFNSVVDFQKHQKRQK